jgi:hypothetical protein
MSAEIKIHMKFNVETGKKDIVIEYDTEDDALPYEHEQRHREILEQLIGKGILKPDDVGNVKVGRVEGQKGSTTQQQDAPQGQTEGVGQG